MRNQVKTASDALFEIVEGQQGYFTAKQAADVGYQLGSQAHHVKSGNWVRVERGIYRLARFPQSAEEQLVIYALWSRNRAGEPEGVYSHQTALSIHELSDVNPAKLHMTRSRQLSPPGQDAEATCAALGRAGGKRGRAATGFCCDSSTPRHRRSGSNGIRFA